MKKILLQFVLFLLPIFAYAQTPFLIESEATVSCTNKNCSEKEAGDYVIVVHESQDAITLLYGDSDATYPYEIQSVSKKGNKDVFAVIDHLQRHSTWILDLELQTMTNIVKNGSTVEETIYYISSITEVEED